eukprot:GHVU01218819.1.p1 GENE.GHVU01218819.1~~GHVU01218819.1.p1  ORF type:complete len:134 (-),score=17.40 GHVU01218819.1:597-998(-)
MGEPARTEKERHDGKMKGGQDPRRDRIAGTGEGGNSGRREGARTTGVGEARTEAGGEPARRERRGTRTQTGTERWRSHDVGREPRRVVGESQDDGRKGAKVHGGREPGRKMGEDEELKGIRGRRHIETSMRSI